ncbi:hypothetical protein K449DRAFT_102109 [Hypoxylon sp. EC38]|nr:hypothetical protein K449DRAFT_102109 [Hypoxylon sp. EC38]
MLLHLSINTAWFLAVSLLCYLLPFDCGGPALLSIMTEIGPLKFHFSRQSSCLGSYKENPPRRATHDGGAQDGASSLFLFFPLSLSYIWAGLCRTSRPLLSVLCS